MAFYLGLDVGGTKTHCLIADEHGAIEGFGAAATGNYEYNGVEPAAVENRKAVDAALSDAGLSLADIASIGMGVAGADLPEDYEMLEKEIYSDLFGDIPRVFRNDSFAGLRGGTRDPYGIVISCGTGCVCAGRNRHGKETRVGGLGEEFGDECTGTSIGMEGLRAVWQARDDIIPPTLLTGLFVEKSGCADVNELFHRMYHGEITTDSLQPIARLVFDAALAGDRKAYDILERGGRYLAAMVIAAGRRLNMEQDTFEVVRTGSVFKGSSPALLETMTSEIVHAFPGASVVAPIYEPVVGALLLGMDGRVTMDDAFYSALTANLKETERRFGVSLVVTERQP